MLSPVGDAGAVVMLRGEAEDVPVSVGTESDVVKVIVTSVVTTTGTSKRAIKFSLISSIGVQGHQKN